MFRKKYLIVVELLLVTFIGQSETGGTYFDDRCSNYGLRSNVTEKYKIELRKDSRTRLFLDSHQSFQINFR